MINESAWGHREKLKPHSLKLARKILVCVGSSAFLRSWSPFLGGQQPTLVQPSCEHSRGNTIRLQNNSCKKTKGVFCICCLFAKQWTSLLLKEVQLSCQKCYTLSRLGETRDRTRRGGNKKLKLHVYSHLARKCYGGIFDQITERSRSIS